MIQKLKKKFKDQRGMTLIELLAVIVILAIISAIAIPSILGLIDNSKKDAHVANAQQMINSAKLAVAGDDSYRPTATGEANAKTITMSDLETKGYLESVKDPDGSTYDKAASKVWIISNGPGSGYSYKVYLKSNGGKTIGGNSVSTAIAEDQVKRSNVSP